MNEIKIQMVEQKTCIIKIWLIECKANKREGWIITGKSDEILIVKWVFDYY